MQRLVVALAATILLAPALVQATQPRTLDDASPDGTSLSLAGTHVQDRLAYPAQTDSHAGRLDQQLRHLDLAEDLLATDARPDLADDAAAFLQAERIDRYQIAALDIAGPDDVEACRSSSLTQAAARAASVRDASLTDDDLDALDRIEAPRTRAALQDLLDAFCTYHRATDDAYAPADPAASALLQDILARDDRGRDTTGRSAPFTEDQVALLAREGLDPTRDTPLLFQAGVDPGAFARILTARDRLVNTVDALRTAVDRAGSPPVDICRPGAVCIDLRPDHDRTYHADYAFQLDVGGDDTYRNNAGGGSGDAAALVDLGGSDTYDVERTLEPVSSPSDRLPTPLAGGAAATTGGGLVGAGFLLDAHGDDTYTAASVDAGTLYAANGGSYLGAGFLLDLGGDDSYNASAASHGVVGANGGGWGGTAMLLDAGGDDRYSAYGPGGGTIAVNGGSERGVGVLVDTEGADTYAARSPGEPDDPADSNWGPDGVNGGSLQISAFLLDVRGDDRYVVASSGGRLEGPINGGGSLGTGFLHDRAGDDTYTVTLEDVGGGHAINGGGYHGVGTLLDDRGDDVYEVAVEGSLTGDGSGSANGGAQAGFGLLFDGTGQDRYDEAHGTTCDNRDTADCTRVPKGRVGAMVDGGSGRS